MMSAPARSKLESLGLSASCAEVLAHLWDYLDEQITPTSAERLRAHIATCTQCRKYEEYQECFLRAMSSLKQELNAPHSLRERLAERLKGQGCGCWNKVSREP
jgi:anti-sigma factor (TIGR02949 family)